MNAKPRRGAYALVAALLALPAVPRGAAAQSAVWLPTDEPGLGLDREFRFVLGSGVQWLDVDALNTTLRAMGAHPYDRVFFYRPLSLAAELTIDGNGFGFEAKALDNPQSDEIRGGYQNNITFFSLSLGYFRVLHATTFYRLYPGVSLGFTELHNVIQPHAPDGIEFSQIQAEPRQSSHLVTNALTLSGYVALEFPFWLWGSERRRGGLAPGLRVGYVQELLKSASDDTWVQHGQQIRGGPSLKLSGPLVQAHVALVFGG